VAHFLPDQVVFQASEATETPSAACSNKKKNVEVSPEILGMTDSAG
jgi:hypothetical protein